MTAPEQWQLDMANDAVAWQLAGVNALTSPEIARHIGDLGAEVLELLESSEIVISHPHTDTPYFLDDLTSVRVLIAPTTLQHNPRAELLIFGQVDGRYIAYPTGVIAEQGSNVCAQVLWSGHLPNLAVISLPPPDRMPLEAEKGVVMGHEGTHVLQYLGRSVVPPLGLVDCVLKTMAESEAHRVSFGMQDADLAGAMSAALHELLKTYGSDPMAFMQTETIQLCGNTASAISSRATAIYSVLARLIDTIFSFDVAAGEVPGNEVVEAYYRFGILNDLLYTAS